MEAIFLDKKASSRSSNFLSELIQSKNTFMLAFVILNMQPKKTWAKTIFFLAVKELY